MTLDELNALPPGEAREALASCCGVGAWVADMERRRPFADRETLLRVADEVWWSLGPGGWREMFAHHPRIGERVAAKEQEARARAWSASEQRGVATAGDGVRVALADGNREYERRFGHIYLVAAAGRSADELLAILRQRLANTPEDELRVAAGEQATITRRRLLALLGERAAPPTADARSPLAR